MLSFIRNGWLIFQSGYIILYSVQKCMDYLIFPHTAFSAITIFPFNQCKEYIEIAHWGFNLQLLDSNWYYYFPCAYLPYLYSLSVIFVYVFFPFWNTWWLLILAVVLSHRYFCDENINDGLQTSLNDIFNRFVAQRELIIALIRIAICGVIGNRRGIERQHTGQECLHVYLWSGDH